MYFSNHFSRHLKAFHLESIFVVISLAVFVGFRFPQVVLNFGFQAHSKTTLCCYTYVFSLLSLCLLTLFSSFTAASIQPSCWGTPPPAQEFQSYTGSSESLSQNDAREREDSVTRLMSPLVHFWPQG